MLVADGPPLIEIIAPHNVLSLGHVLLVAAIVYVLRPFCLLFERLGEAAIGHTIGWY